MGKNSSTLFIVGTLVLGLGFLGILVFSRQGQPTSFERELITLAESVGMDGDKFFEDYSNDEVRSRVAEDIRFAEELGVNATPSAFINGEKIDTTADYAAFREIISDKIDNAAELPITLQIFEDYQCPFCANFFPVPYFAEAEFGADLVVEHYHFPLDNHQLARRYAYAAEAAREQDKYFEMSKAIFESESGQVNEQLNELLNEGSVEETLESIIEETPTDETPTENQDVATPEETVENTTEETTN